MPSPIPPPILPMLPILPILPIPDFFSSLGMSATILSAVNREAAPAVSNKSSSYHLSWVNDFFFYHIHKISKHSIITNF